MNATRWVRIPRQPVAVAALPRVPMMGRSWGFRLQEQRLEGLGSPSVT